MKFKMNKNLYVAGALAYYYNIFSSQPFSQIDVSKIPNTNKFAVKVFFEN